jgi:hypothetical protein
MADGFIVRKGGAVTEQALAPTITEVSITGTSITFTITNNDASTAVILYEVDDATPDENSIELAAAATSSNITVTGLSEDVEYDVYATANVTGKVKSNVTQLAITTEEPPVYTAATGGTTLEYDSGGKRYKSHTFTSDDDFEVTTVGDAIDDRNKVDYLIIAGGGSGGVGGGNQGGGGAGGFRTTITPVPNDQTADAKKTVTAQTYEIVIGSGGSSVSGSGVNISGNNGTNSTAFGETATGGGFGGNESNTSGNGGSSGGAGASATSVGTRIINEGNLGGLGDTDGVTYGTGGGGGGAGAVGQASTSSNGGDGGNGLANLLRIGSNETRAGGGGGGGDTRESLPAGSGGTGGGGAGNIGSGNATAGTVNTGSGGGGVGFGSGTRTTGQGGSGIVIIRYEIAPSV